jgi:hypothetical protein
MGRLQGDVGFTTYSATMPKPFVPLVRTHHIHMCQRVEEQSLTPETAVYFQSIHVIPLLEVN